MANYSARWLFAASLSLMGLPDMGAADTCDDGADQVTLTQCAAASFSEADAELNARYKEIEHRLVDAPDIKELLKKAQRSWIAFRDTECAFQSSAVQGGSEAPMIVAGCMESLTRDRLASFESYLSCDEYDTSCPVPPAE
jgi:uncharacterized protein YecT (DUF1311 family)